MSVKPSRRSLVAVGLLGMAALTGLLLPPGRGAPPDRPESAARPRRTYLDAEACTRCHGQAEPSKDPSALVRLNEKQVWFGEDKHHQAYQALEGERGKTILKILKIPDVTEARQCLSCHSTGFLNPPLDPKLASPATLRGMTEGVTCAACHGSYEDYSERHGLTGDIQDEWRTFSAQEKQDKYGMTDLRDPARRAEVCFSCHIGNAKEGKIVTHAMYAAGHPPLPAIELTMLSRSMPSHWDEPEDVRRFQQPDPTLLKRYHYVPGEKHRTKSTVIGGAVALRESLALLASESEQRAAGKSEATWPEFAVYDCAACHHDLQFPAGNHAVPKGMPGRPKVRVWPFLLAELGLVHVESGTADRTLRKEYTQASQALRDACDARPFGKALDVAGAAHGLKAWSEKLTEALRSSPWDATVPPLLLTDLTTLALREPLDYDSARQFAWAFHSIYDDWQPKPPHDPDIRAALAELNRQLQSAADYHPDAFQKALANLAGLL